MGKRTPGLWPFAAAGAIAVVAVTGLVVVWLSPHRDELEGFGGLALSVFGIAAGWVAWIWRTQSRQATSDISGQELGRLADLLAEAVDEEWTRAAGERGLLEPAPIPVRWRRPATPFAGPAAAAVASTRFTPLPGLAAVDEQRLRAGRLSELHEVYGGLGSGRLVIAGAPGSGKTSAAVLLILAALRYRKSVSKKIRSEVPVPVMFTVQGWDPSTQRARDWLAQRLCQTYPLFAGKQGAGAARVMLDEDRIAVILDGLDEIPEDMRPAVLRALSQQATFRLVLLARTAEMAAAAAQALLQGAAAIELQDITPATAADYLTHTQLDPLPHGWHELTSSLRQEPGSPLARALNSPLMLTLVRDTYRVGDDAGDLVGLRNAAGYPASSDDIADHLLDRVLPAAYTQQPGEPPLTYDLVTAERALRRIAARMNEEGTRDLRWWRIPGWVHAAPRVIVTCLAVGVVSGLVFGLGVGIADGLSYGLGAGLGYGILVGLVAGLAVGRGDKIPRRIAPVRWRHLFRRTPVVVGLLAALVTGGWAGFGGGGPVAGWAGAAVAGLVAGLGTGLIAGMSRPGTDSTSPLSPLGSWRSDRAFGLMTGLVAGLVFGIGVGFVSGLINGLQSGPGRGLTNGPLVALVFGFGVGFAVALVYPQSWRSSLAFAQLAMSDRTPVRLMRFLEDARGRNVLRTVGPVYQFRHARLQDRLAVRKPVTGQGPSTARPTAGKATASAAEPSV